MTLELQGIVCGRYPIGETSLLVHLLTDTRGKLVVRARGALRDFRRVGAALDTAARSEWILGGRVDGIPLVHQVDLVDAHSRLRRDLARLLRACFLIEVVRLHYSQGGRLYDHLATGLATLDRGGSAERAFLWWFTLRTLEISGHAPVLQRCVACGRDRPPVGLAPALGGVLCSPCAIPGRDLRPMSAAAIAALRGLSAAGGVDPSATLQLSTAVATEIGTALRLLISWPVGGDVALPALHALQYLGRSSAP